jgi:glycosyltransferase involved in cell wall biosynthesis
MFRDSGKRTVQVLGHPSSAELSKKGFRDRSDILFVGALDDDLSPNVDSIVWFVRDVLPVLDRLLGSAYSLNVVGRNKASRLKEIAGTRVKFFGMVENVQEFYSDNRILIAPTRFAAGIPIKLIDAAAAGLPAVATPLLADQLGWRSGIEVLAGSSPVEFAQMCHRLYVDEQVWQQIRQAVLERVKRDFGMEKFTADVASILGRIPIMGELRRTGGSTVNVS